MALINFTTTFYIVVGIAILHTLAGSDRYQKFWSLAKSHKWSMRRNIFDRNMNNFNTSLFASAGRLKNIILAHHTSHLLPGVVICGCGLAMLLLGV